VTPGSGRRRALLALLVLALVGTFGAFHAATIDGPRPGSGTAIERVGDRERFAESTPARAARPLRHATDARLLIPLAVAAVAIAALTRRQWQIALAPAAAPVPISAPHRRVASRAPPRSSAR
jgi:hypothetical protein